MDGFAAWTRRRDAALAFWSAVDARYSRRRDEWSVDRRAAVRLIVVPIEALGSLAASRVLWIWRRGDYATPQCDRAVTSR